MKTSSAMNVNIQTKSAVSVAEMARMCGLSRARFYQLMGEGVFPQPVYDVRTKRPHFTEDMQMLCLEVRKRNCGVNGQPVLFYSARHPIGVQHKPVRKSHSKPKTNGQHNEVVAGLRALGLESVSAAQVELAISKLFPTGIQKLESGEIIRSVFLHLKRRDTADNVGR